jgi:hypothetical protein
MLALAHFSAKSVGLPRWRPVDRPAARLEHYANIKKNSSLKFPVFPFRGHYFASGDPQQEGGVLAMVAREFFG